MEKSPPQYYPSLPAENSSMPMPSAPPPPYSEAIQHRPQLPAPVPNPPVNQPAPIQQVFVSSSLGPASQPLNCPKCHKNIYTRVEIGSTCKTHFCAIFLCLFLCWPCVCCPYCTDCCRTRKHYCPSCRTHIGNDTS